MLPEYEESDSYRKLSDTTAPEEWNYSRLVTLEHTLIVAVPSWVPCEPNGEGQVDLAVIVEPTKKSASRKDEPSSRIVSASFEGVIPPAERHWVRYPRPTKVQENSNSEIQMQKVPEEARVVTRFKEIRPTNVKAKPNGEIPTQPKQKVPEEARVTRSRELLSSNVKEKPNDGIMMQPKQKPRVVTSCKDFRYHQTRMRLIKNS